MIKDGHPVCLYITSGGHEPGPQNSPREWTISHHWQGKAWRSTVITTSDHNYDMGSLWIDGDRWTFIAPVGNQPQEHGGGGEVELWISEDNGQHWSKQKELTRNSKFNNSYVRKVVNGKAPFQYFWADGHPGKMSKSQLYFGSQDGQAWRLPYKMKRDWMKPKKR